MSALQNPTGEAPAITYESLDDAKRSWIDYRAVGGLIADADGTLRKMSVGEFSSRVSVHRDTLYDWEKRIPGFWDMVAGRRYTLAKSRTPHVWNGILLRAMKGDAQQATMWLSHFDDYKPPAQKGELEVTIKGFAELVQAASTQGIIEGEIVDPGTSGQNLPARTAES